MRTGTLPEARYLLYTSSLFRAVRYGRGFGNNNFGCPRTGQPRPSESHFHTSPGVPRTRGRRTDWRDDGSVATGQRSCQQAAFRHAVSEPIDFAGVRVSSVGRLRGRRDIDAQSSKLSILRKTQV